MENEKNDDWFEREWRQKVKAALKATGKPYIAIVLESDNNRAVTFATATRGTLPEILRGIAMSIELGELTSEDELS